MVIGGGFVQTLAWLIPRGKLDLYWRAQFQRARGRHPDFLIQTALFYFGIMTPASCLPSNHISLSLKYIIVYQTHRIVVKVL